MAVSVEDANAGKYDFYVDVETATDSKNKLFATMSISSKKLEDSKKCKTVAAPIFTTSVVVNKNNYKEAARQLVENTFSCELLKKLEAQALNYPYCYQNH